MSDQPQAPPPANRPKFWRYYRERDLTAEEVARHFNRSREWVRLITLPFDDPARRVPDKNQVEAIRSWSGNEVRPEHWYPAPEATAAILTQEGDAGAPDSPRAAPLAGSHVLADAAGRAE